jgi:SAM-dependent methyltransferase
MNYFMPLFIIKQLQRKIFERYSTYLKGSILDIGCGTRPYQKYLSADCQYIGIDESSEVNPDLVANAISIPFADEYFNSVLCTEVLEHLPEPKEALKEIKRVLKKDGHLYLTVPQEWCLHYEPEDYFRFTKYGITYLLEKEGFRVIAVERIGGVFSLVGQRIIDCFWQFFVDGLKPILKAKWAERLASLLCFVPALFFYLLAIVGDKIDKRDALGWAVLAIK